MAAETACGATPALARLAAQTTLADVPAPVRQRIKDCFVDFIANAAFASAAAESSTPFRAAVRAMAADAGGGAVQGTVIGDAVAYPPMLAALLNGAHAHTLDFDDTNNVASLHPGAPVGAAALAEAERLDAGGDRLLTALVVGNEVCCRVGAALGSTTYDRGFHNTAIAGIFGAVAAAGHLRGCPAQTLEQALGLAGSKAAGSMQYLDNGAWNKRLHPGFAAHDALMCLAFAEAGVLGAAQPIEGRYGLLAAYCNGPEPARLTDGLGSTWLAGQTVLKPYPSCRFTHSAIDAALALRPRLTETQRRHGHWRLSLSPKAWQIVGEPLPNKRRAGNIVEAQFSVYFQTALALLEGRCDWQGYARIDDAELLACAARIEVTADPALARKAALLTLADDETVSVHVEEPLGEASRPFSAADVRAKFDGLAVPVFGGPCSAEIWGAVRTLERLPSVRGLTALLRRGATS